MNRGMSGFSKHRKWRLALVAPVLAAVLGGSALAQTGGGIPSERKYGSICETHPVFNAAFRAALAATLKKVRSEKQLAKIIEQVMIIDREVRRHEWAHYNAAKGWVYLPRFKFVTLYKRKYAIGGCVSIKRGIPPKLAIAAALAPEYPSEIDWMVAFQAQADMRRQRIQPD